MFMHVYYNHMLCACVMNAGVISEAAKFVEALTANYGLQREFIEVVKKPRSALMQLSQKVRHQYLASRPYLRGSLIGGSTVLCCIFSCRLDRRG